MLRKATIRDLDRMVDIVEEIKEEMRREGSDQFGDDYPIRFHFEEDIKYRHLYVKGIGTDIAGIICINNEEIPNSEHLYWTKVTPCTSMYRLFVNKLYRRRGIARELILLGEDISRKEGLNYVKAATYKINNSMISLFNKLGYKFVGEIKGENRKYPFLCYEKLL